MTQEEFFADLAELVEEPVESLRMETLLEDIEGWDSMAVVGFMAWADEKCQVRISPRQFPSCVTVADLSKLINL